ncbi:MAG: transcription termination factor NusA [Lachnospiraceae bacterium]|nr:transcription termination factor NusA [Lachnospiraceae bacterium]
MAPRKKSAAKAAPAENNELLLALEAIEKEKGISKEVMLDTIESSLIIACKDEFKQADNIKINFDPVTSTFRVFEEKTVVDVVEDDATQISKEAARIRFDSPYEVGDIVNIEVTPKDFGRKAAQKSKQIIVQKIREEEKKALFSSYSMKEKDIVTGVIQCFQDPDRGNYNIIVSLGKIETILPVTEQIKGEEFYKNERVKLYVTKVEDTQKGPRVCVSRTHPELVKRLFEEEVTEIADGIVEIKSISREAGQRTKIAVHSNDENVDPVGACVGVNGTRVNAIVDELHGEKIDIIVWSEDPAVLIENSLSPAKVVSVTVDPDEKKARVIVPDYQLSLAIGREGQNARLAAKLTGYKIDIKSESQDQGIETETQEFSEEEE